MKKIIEQRIKQLKGFKAESDEAVAVAKKHGNFRSLDFKCGFVYAIKEEINFLEILLSEIK
jgi:hypothetical protein